MNSFWVTRATCHQMTFQKTASVCQTKQPAPTFNGIILHRIPNLWDRNVTAIVRWRCVRNWSTCLTSPGSFLIKRPML